MLSYQRAAPDDPAIRAVISDMRMGQRRELFEASPAVTAERLIDDIARLPEAGREYALHVIYEDHQPRAVVIAIETGPRVAPSVALAMVATRDWEGGIPVGVYRWFARVYLPLIIDSTDFVAALVEVIRFPDTPPRAHDWLRRLGFAETRVRRILGSPAKRVTFSRLAPHLRSTPDRKAS